MAVNGNVFTVAGDDGTVLALDAPSGRELWRAEVGTKLSAGVGSDGRFAAVVTRGTELVVIEAGRIVWRKALGVRVSNAPLVAGERVFVLAVDRSVHAFDVLDGQLLWTSKRPLVDLVASAAAGLTADPGSLRVMVGHGAVDVLSPDRDNPAVIRVADAEKAIFEGRFQYLALGDRHSLTNVGTSGRIFYSGTHEAYDFDEVDPGKVLIVDLSEEGATVTPRQNGVWRFIVHEGQISSIEDIEALSRHLESLQDKERTILKLGLVGTLSIQLHARLEAIEEHARDLFAAVVRSGSRSELVVMPDNSDFENLSLAGFADSAVEKLRAQAQGSGPQAEQAIDALALLMRLAGRAA